MIENKKILDLTREELEELAILLVDSLNKDGKPSLSKVSENIKEDCIEEGYNLPVDRPSKVWCRVCKKWEPTQYGTKTAGGTAFPPKNLSTWYCGACNVTGSLVFRWGSLIEEKIVPVKRWESKCGNPDCDGTCNNMLCIPPIEEMRKRVEEGKALQKIVYKDKIVYKKTKYDLVTRVAFPILLIFNASYIGYILTHLL